MLDLYQRKIDYMRISITDRCHFQCAYCKNDHPRKLKHQDILSYEQLLLIVDQAIQLGINKFKITGGEPTIRKDYLFFIKELATNLGISDARTVNLTQKHIRGRLAESLIFLKENYGLEQDGSTLNIYMAREDLANLSNMTTSNAIRTLSCFVNEKIIIVDGRKIKILDEEKLKKISKFG